MDDADSPKSAGTSYVVYYTVIGAGAGTPATASLFGAGPRAALLVAAFKFAATCKAHKNPQASQTSWCHRGCGQVQDIATASGNDAEVEFCYRFS